jgi:1,2-diacylglycerol 3-alpha-glucosyltransferase
MTKVFFLCSGLSNVQRGFESFTQECFEALSTVPSLDITLFKGGGKSNHKEVSLWNLHRNTWAAIQIGKLTGRGAYLIEQVSFFLSLLPHIYRQKPNVIYFSDGNVGNMLWQWRRLTKQKYKLLFSNGGSLSPPFHRWDLVQQLTPSYWQAALDAGESKSKQCLVPYGVKVSSKAQILADSEQKQLRKQLGLLIDQPIILSVGAINKSHKRMDYLIREIASLPEPHPYLLLLGQAESPEIIQLGENLLGSDSFQVKTVTADRVASYYQAADVFVLASLGEGFGRVFLEAMSYGLPCLAHDYEVARFVLGEEGYFANFKLTGSLTHLIDLVMTEKGEVSKRNFRHQSIYDRFSWEKLRPAYIEMIHQCVTSTNEEKFPSNSSIVLES